MKTFTFILMVLIAPTIKTNAQIPNNGFEDWTNIGNCIEPTSWYSFYSLFDSTGSYCPVTRSTDHYPDNIGSYSVRIANDTAIWNSGITPGSFLGWGMLLSTELNDRPLFPVTGHPKALRGYYKFLPQNGDTMNININLYKNGVAITMGRFQSDVETPDWTSFQIYFNDTSYSSVDSARISLSSSNEPKDGSKGPLGNSVLYIDNLSFDTLITSVGSSSRELPIRFNLEQNYPNPFNPTTTISFSLPSKSFVSLKVFDVVGREVATLLDGIEEPGLKLVTFNANGLVSGVYYYRLQTTSFTETKKLTLLR